MFSCLKIKNIIKYKIFFISFLLLLVFLFLYLDEHFKQRQKKEENDKLSIIVNMKYLTKDRHSSFYQVMKKLNSTRNYYFIKNVGRILNKNLGELVDNTTIKIVQSNFPDSYFLPFVVSLYGNNIPEFVFLIEGEDIFDKNITKLIKWYNLAYMQIIGNNYDYIFGNSQIIDGKKIGCSILLSKSAIIQHLLYHTDSDTTHINPFIQLSLATETKFNFLSFNYIKISELDNTHGKFSLNMKCPAINDNALPSLCIMIPSFKRNYFSSSFSAFSKQTYKPKFYLIIQNDNRIHFDLSRIQNLVNEPVYHIWMQNWNSFFFLNHRLSSVLPCDFVFKFDDDQWPRKNYINEILINNTRNKNILIGNGGCIFDKSLCEYTFKGHKHVEEGDADHVSVPLFVRPGYFKLDARNKIYRLYGAEDISLSVNSFKLCNVTAKVMKIKLIEKQNDKKNQRRDQQIISVHKSDKEKDPKFSIFKNTYCYLIRSGYIPKKYQQVEIPGNDYINIELEHKKLF